MTRASYVTPGQTAARIDNLQRLVAELMIRPLRRDEIANLLQMGPSGVRKYLVDLGGRVTTARSDDGLMCFLAITTEQAQAYLAQLATAPVARPTGVPKRPSDIAKIGAGRLVHIMEDDVHYSVRLSLVTPARDPLVAALFGARDSEVRA
jgi:predicted transcriptional regulator